MASFLYDCFGPDLLAGAVQPLTHTLRLLLADGYWPDPAHRRRSDVTGEVSGPGYTAGGQDVQGRALTLPGRLDAADVVWPRSRISARWAVLYRARGGSPEADELVACFDLGGLRQSAGGDFRVAFDDDGLIEARVKE